MKKLFKTLIAFIVKLILIFGIFLLYSTLTDYKPGNIEKISESEGAVINIYDTINMFSWNLGYCGLGDDMSFFYDGGDKTRTSKERTHENLNKIKKQIEKHDTIDFFLFQEVDKKSRRSYKTNQLDSIAAILPDFYNYFALNYKVAFVPSPPLNPMGKVLSGLASFSKYKPYNVSRYSFPANFDWPVGLFFLDRCFMVQRFYTSNGKELLVINTHNSAFDDGSLRKQQMKILKNFVLDEYKKGNYIIAGGDWNQNPPKKGKESKKRMQGRLTQIRLASDFMPQEWNWQFCEEIPTNRMIDEVYNPDKTVTTTIDFFLLSPNLTTISQKNIDLQFKNSDHQPVLLSFIFLR